LVRKPEYFGPSSAGAASYHPTALAKKPRTPAPPRPVQAPKRRDSRKGGPASASDRRTRWLLYGLAALGPIALIVVAVIVLTGRNDSSKDATGDAPDINYASLPGVRTGPAPWAPEYEKLPDRLSTLQLHALSAEALAFHIHQHLDIYVDGKHQTVPPNIGIDEGSFITELHTHDGSGVMHVESAETRPYTLGQFMGVWGVRFSKKCIGSYCGTEAKPLHVFVNGNLFTGDPNDLVLKNHQEIAIVYGARPAKLPKTYDFAAYGV